MNESLHEIVRSAETNLLSGTVKLGDYVDFSHHDTVETIYAYVNSRHITGPKDSLDRDKPFFNIVTAAVNIWYRATDLDRKDIIVIPDRLKNTIAAFFATIFLQEWMKKERFGVFLNTWGRALAQYGSAVVKFVEKNGRLCPTVIPWNRLITDPIDFEALPRIEKFYKTPAQLQNMANPSHPDYAGYSKEAVDSAIESRSSRETLDREQKDNQSDFVELYEVHGQLPRSILLESQGKEYTEKDKEDYIQQMHVICWTKSKESTGKEYQDFTLFSGKEKKDPYMITHLIEEEGRTLSIGAVEYLFDAQWMQNHTIKAWKDQMDLSSRLIFQTADQDFIGRNVLTNIEVGDVLIHKPNMPVTQFPNTGHDINNLQVFMNQWKLLSQEVTSTPDAVRGNTLPSGTPYSLGAYLGTQSLSLFELMTENKGHHLEAMLREFVIPFLKTKMNNKDEIMAMLDDAGIKKIDSMYIPNEAARRYNKKLKDALLSGRLPEGLDLASEEQDITKELSSMSNQRAFAPGDVNWNKVFEDLEWKLDVGITNEQTDKQAVLSSLTTVLQTLATNPMVLQDPNARLIFNKVLAQTGVVSPVELSAIPPPAPPVPSPIQPSATKPELAIK